MRFFSHTHIFSRLYNLPPRQAFWSSRRPDSLATRVTLISMEEPKIITIADVIDSTVMHINKGNPLFARESKGNPHGTQGEPSNKD